MNLRKSWNLQLIVRLSMTFTHIVVLQDHQSEVEYWAACSIDHPLQLNAFKEVTSSNEKKEEYILNMKKGYFLNDYLGEELYGQLKLAKQTV